MKTYNIYPSRIGYEATEFKDGKWCLLEDHLVAMKDLIHCNDQLEVKNSDLTQSNIKYEEYIKELQKELGDYQDLYVQIETDNHKMLEILKQLVEKWHRDEQEAEKDNDLMDVMLIIEVENIIKKVTKE